MRQLRRWLALIVVSLGVACAIWRLDVAGTFSAPGTWLQGHAIWHFLMAVSLGCMVPLYRSEVPDAPGGGDTRVGGALHTG